MATKLIIVEGLPGSGKSTTAQMVYNILLVFHTFVFLDSYSFLYCCSS